VSIGPPHAPHGRKTHPIALGQFRVNEESLAPHRDKATRYPHAHPGPVGSDGGHDDAVPHVEWLAPRALEGGYGACIPFICKPGKGPYQAMSRKAPGICGPNTNAPARAAPTATMGRRRRLSAVAPEVYSSFARSLVVTLPFACANW
jgi:hypothetical protein